VVKNEFVAAVLDLLPQFVIFTSAAGLEMKDVPRIGNEPMQIGLARIIREGADFGTSAR